MSGGPRRTHSIYDPRRAAVNFAESDRQLTCATRNGRRFVGRASEYRDRRRHDQAQRFVTGCARSRAARSAHIRRAPPDRKSAPAPAHAPRPGAASRACPPPRRQTAPGSAPPRRPRARGTAHTRASRSHAITSSSASGAIASHARRRAAAVIPDAAALLHGEDHCVRRQRAPAYVPVTRKRDSSLARSNTDRCPATWTNHALSVATERAVTPSASAEPRPAA